MNDQPVQLGFDMFAAAEPVSELPDPDEVRQELLLVLAQAKAAQDQSPWDARTLKYHKVVFPQMANWLPDDEARQLRFAFALEVERIEQLLAA